MKKSSEKIDKLAWICINNGKLLVVRSKGKSSFYIPGGKRDPGESDTQALRREIKEEVSVDLIQESIKFFGMFEALAHDKPEGVFVKITVYSGKYHGELAANSEIEELKWVTYGEKILCSEATQHIMSAAFNKSLLKS